MEFLKIEEGRRLDIINETAAKMGVLSQAVEKDWWVTQTLRALFTTGSAKYFVFKGGTSLSKGWGLIQRFSEDIDLALDRAALGISKNDDEISGKGITKMRVASKQFVSTTLLQELKKALIGIGIPDELFVIEAVETEEEGTDPQVILVKYNSLTEPNEYFKPEVKIEVMVRSMLNPHEERQIRSFIGTEFPDSSFADSIFEVVCAHPQKTFLEKIFLLHELFVIGSIKDGRFRSRHLSDIEKIMDTEFGRGAIENTTIYDSIVKFRAKFTKVKGVDYGTHSHETIDFIPPIEVKGSWEKDYSDLAENMFRNDGKALPFSDLIERLELLKERFREKGRKKGNEESKVIIYTPNGTIRDKNSYGNDPHPARDTKH